MLFTMDEAMYLSRVLRSRPCLVPGGVEADRISEAKTSNGWLSIWYTQEEVLIIFGRVCADICSVLRLGGWRNSVGSCQTEEQRGR
jgi:hypothetical protein